MKHLENCIDRLMQEKTIEHIAVRVGRGDAVLYETYRGANTTTLFDMASVSKIIATTSLALIAMDRGMLKLTDQVGDLTIYQLLTHTIGIGHKALNKEGNTYENVGEYILNIPKDIPVGTDVLYSCPGFILLGKHLEALYGKPLDVLLQEEVAVPLGMKHTCYCPTERTNVVNANPTEEERGIVNDYNCRFLGKIAGNAGVFSCMEDMDRFAQMLLHRGTPIISEKTFDLAAQNHTASMSASRGLGFLYVDERYAQTGGLFPKGSIGHCGHTGQSVFADPVSGLYVIILSDATRTIKQYGDGNYKTGKQMRAALHAAIGKDFSNP